MLNLRRECADIPRSANFLPILTKIMPKRARAQIRLIESLDLTREEKDKILGGNIAGVMGL